MGDDDIDYARFHARMDILLSIELLKDVLPLVRGNPFLRKWAIIGAHDALPGALVCALRDSSGTSVMTKEAAKAVLVWRDAEERGKYPDGRLECFQPLLDRCLSARVVEATAEQVEKVRHLHTEFRNEFLHFRPPLALAGRAAAAISYAGL